MTNSDYSLHELNRLVRSVLESSLDDEYWVVGELSDASQGYGGHFYGELIEKEEDGKRILARAKVTCWARAYNMICMRFMRDTGQTLHAGMRVRLLVRVTFHEQYGYALNIIDVDSHFTLGDMVRRRREILEQLEKDGIIHDNKELCMPRLLKRIAVISAEGAAGYGDFCNQLAKNDYGLYFHVRLFPAVMQGNRVEATVAAALQTIADQYTHWDVVVIIRGGGATGDLSDFDSYLLASCIAQFPIPVITGIGHDRDETVLDYVAHTRVKTPTAAAAFIIEHQAQEAALLDELYRRITRTARERLLRESQRMEKQAALLPLLTHRITERTLNHIEQIRIRLSTSLHLYMQRERHRLELIEQRLKTGDPTLLLRRGFTITTCQGKVVTDISNIQPGGILHTLTFNGEINSTVTSCKKKN
ncbi:MAG: exodeoxyribonuclease VII large subunit [Bacteroidaceae bacterium]